MFIKDKAKLASRVGCSERGVLYFRKLWFKSDKKKLWFRRVESESSLWSQQNTNAESETTLGHHDSVWLL